MNTSYPPSSYDSQLCLRINDTLWLILLFLLRPYVASILSVVNPNDRMGLINLFYSDKFTLVLGVLAGIPAALIIFAWIKKKPGAAAWIKTIWRNGRLLLSTSALLNAAIIFVPFWTGSTHKLTVTGWAQLAISLIILPTLYLSTYIRDCFADYPAEPDKSST